MMKSWNRLPRSAPGNRPAGENRAAPKGAWRKFGGYVAAQWSIVREGPIADEEYDSRIRACLGCPHRTHPSQVRNVGSIVGFCRKCGCPATPASRLEEKAWRPKAKCPLELWGPVEGTGFSARLVLLVLVGVVGQVFELAGRWLGNRGRVRPSGRVLKRTSVRIAEVSSNGRRNQKHGQAEGREGEPDPRRVVHGSPGHPHG